ncbi:MAG TPA: hypothetical protein VNI77_03975 [Nitrososphaera sp.]|nr:hypothetical protein [Nitrososphaera sp.]
MMLVQSTWQRDYNASINDILKRGLQILQLPVERREVTPVETAMQSRKQEKKPMH